MTSAFVIDESLKAVRALVPDYQLSLAIGKEGQNARLAAKLTGAGSTSSPTRRWSRDRPCARHPRSVETRLGHAQRGRV